MANLSTIKSDFAMNNRFFLSKQSVEAFVQYALQPHKNGWKFVLSGQMMSIRFGKDLLLPARDDEIVINGNEECSAEELNLLRNSFVTVESDVICFLLKRLAVLEHESLQHQRYLANSRINSSAFYPPNAAAAAHANASEPGPAPQQPLQQPPPQQQQQQYLSVPYSRSSSGPNSAVTSPASAASSSSSLSESSLPNSSGIFPWRDMPYPAGVALANGNATPAQNLSSSSSSSSASAPPQMARHSVNIVAPVENSAPSSMKRSGPPSSNVPPYHYASMDNTGPVMSAGSVIPPSSSNQMYPPNVSVPHGMAQGYGHPTAPLIAPVGSQLAQHSRQQPHSMPQHSLPMHPHQPYSHPQPMSMPSGLSSYQASSVAYTSGPGALTFPSTQAKKEYGEDLSDKAKVKKRKRKKLMRVCENCATTETPKWRRSPDGMMTLCNACGLQFGKYNGDNRKRHQPAPSPAASTSSSSSSSGVPSTSSAFGAVKSAASSNFPTGHAPPTYSASSISSIPLQDLASAAIMSASSSEVSISVSHAPAGQNSDADKGKRGLPGASGDDSHLARLQVPMPNIGPRGPRTSRSLSSPSSISSSIPGSEASSEMSSPDIGVIVPSPESRARHIQLSSARQGPVVTGGVEFPVPSQFSNNGGTSPQPPSDASNRLPADSPRAPPQHQQFASSSASSPSSSALAALASIASSLEGSTKSSSS